MASERPVVRQIAWISLFPQLMIMAALVVIFGMFIKPFTYALDMAMIVYLLSSVLLRNLIPRNHRRGISLYKSGNYVAAIGEYEKSYDFFTKHAWIDKYRFIVLLSSGRISYTEMALLNIAFCYAQIGDGTHAKEYYERALEQFPNSEMAKSALRMLDSATNNPMKDNLREQ